MTSDGADQTLLYAVENYALDVTVDMDRGLLFFADGSGLWEGALAGGEAASQLAAMNDMHFVYVTSVLPPTPAAG